MTVTKVRLSQRAKQELGQDGINEMCRHLYAKDCQSCNKSLGIRPPAVCIEDFGTQVQAQLHHETCHKPTWTTRPAMVLDRSSAPALTYSGRFLLPMGELFPGLGADMPVLLLNPGLEAVTLARGEGGWRVNIVDRYVGYGMQVADQESPVVQIGGSNVYLRDPGDGTHPTVFTRLDALHQWTNSAPHFIANAILRRRGMLLLVTSIVEPDALDPHAFGAPELIELIGSGLCAVGWVPLMRTAAR